MKREKTKLVCQFCGEEFYPKNGHLKQKTCSMECGYKLRNKNGSKKKGKHYSHLRKAEVKICLVCGSEFRAVKDCKKRKQKYCSYKCFKKRYRITNICKNCGKKIKTSIAINKQYCNLECRNLDYRKRMKGKNSRFWKGGKTKKSKIRKTCAEYKEWRMKVFKRDNFTCQECSERNNTIEAHHIKSQSEYPELIYDVDNGLTLCHECHKKTDNYGPKQKKNLLIKKLN